MFSKSFKNNFFSIGYDEHFITLIQITKQTLDPSLTRAPSVGWPINVSPFIFALLQATPVC